MPCVWSPVQGVCGDPNYGGVTLDRREIEAEESAVGLGQEACWSREEFWVVLSDLHRVHYHALVRLAALYLDDAAEDAVQDAFVRVSLHYDRIRDADKILVYLRRAVLNNAKSELRHRLTVRRHPPVLPLSAPAGEVVALSCLGEAAIVACLRQLPARQAACVGLRFALDLSERETAEVLEISAGSVKQHTSRAMRKLRPLLGAQDG
jgi:RNA polymerase sigma factor (sigma-70 family)